jgi:hypothetical protein
MESVLIASPADTVTSEQVEIITGFLQSIASRLLITEDGQLAESEISVLRASAQTLGTVLGKAMNIRSGEEVDSLLNEKKVQASLREDLFSALLASAGRVSSDPNLPRYDRKVLALASSIGMHAASVIVRPLVKSLHQALVRGQDMNAKAFAETLHFFFCQKDQLATRVYQELHDPSTTAFDITDALVPRAGVQRGIVSDNSMSTLKLPPTSEEREQTLSSMEKAHAIVMYLRKAYEVTVMRDHFEKLVICVKKVLPPLSDVDTFKLCVFLPLLSAAMESSIDNPWAELEPMDEKSHDDAAGESIEETLGLMASDLVTFGIASDYPVDARSHAARCLHASISRFTTDTSQDCPARRLTTETVLPAMMSYIKDAQSSNKARQKEKAAIDFADVLTIIAALGSAAARRGGRSGSTSDKITLLLVDLACNKKPSDPFSDGEGMQIDTTVFDSPGMSNSTRLSVRSADAFGSVLSCGDSCLWKQRLTHIAVKRILDHIKETMATPTMVHLGCIAAVCQVVCAGNIKNIGKTNLSMISEVVASGLAPASLQAAVQEGPNVIKLVLASVIKLLCIAPEAFGTNMYLIVTGAMRAYATAGNLEYGSEIACKLLALQTLEAAALGSGDSLRTVKPAVVSVLGAAMNHPSGLLRQAAVEVRNAWYLVD